MESASQLKNDERKNLLAEWLKTQCDARFDTLLPIAGDASFRRYFRLQIEEGSRIAVDAAPPQENCRNFMAVANALRRMQLKTPEIFFADFDRGFLLISDFGDLTFLKALNSDNADQLYQLALTALATISQCKEVEGRPTPPFTRDFMWQEWSWHKEWFLGKLLGVTFPEKELDQCYSLLVETAAMQPQTFMHRDYHSANLMLLPNNQVGILDFQDAFIGPVTYDLASLLRDCYIDWPEDRVNFWACDYLQKLQKQNILSDITPTKFLRWFDLMSMQRHLKALMTFARKQVRDHQSEYLKAMPRTLCYLEKVSARYPELIALHEYLVTTIKPAFQKIKAKIL